MNEAVNNTVTGGVSGMSDFVTAITNTTLKGSITSANLWDQIEMAVPIVAVGFIVGFGLYILRRAMRGAQKGKARV